MELKGGGHGKGAKGCGRIERIAKQTIEQARNAVDTYFDYLKS
jgi:hypothetical protein